MMVDGNSQEMLTKELCGGARIHYIFQLIFVKTLEEVKPCQDLTDDDIQTAIQNATGPRNALFVPEVPFQILVRREITRLLAPSLQCLRSVYDEMLKMSRTCEATELQRYPMLRKHVDDVMGKFLRDGVRPAERMIENLIEIEMDYINSSHPKFIGGNKAVELAMQQLRSSQGSRTPSNNQRAEATDSNSTSKTWGSMFRGRTQSADSPAKESADGTLNDVKQSPSTIELRETPSILRPLEMTEQESVEITVTKLLLQSYYDIVRKNIQDLVPKTIMHFLVNHAKRNLHNTFIQKLYRENLVEELLQEQDDFVMKRKQNRELFHALQLAVQTLDEVESEVLFGSLDLHSGIDATTGSSRTMRSHSRTNGENGSSYESSF